MYAIIESGGKQYRVEKDTIVHVELICPTEDKGVEFKNVLFLHDGKQPKIGAPYVEKAIVKGKLMAETKGPKVISFKYKQRKGVRRKVGHRQKYHQVKIIEIVG